MSTRTRKSGDHEARSVLVEQPTALVAGPAAALLSLVIKSPNVRVVVEGLPPWLRPYRAEVAAAVDAIHRAAAAWSSAPGVSGHARGREDAEPLSAAAADCSVREAAALLGLSPRRVQELAGVLGGRRVGRSWVLDGEAVRLVARERRTA